MNGEPSCESFLSGGMERLVDVDAAPVLPPVSLLSFAVTCLAMLACVTGAKWVREASARKARAARSSKKVLVSSESRGAGKVGNSAAKKRSSKIYPEYRMEDVRLHCSAKDAWVAIGDGVYDVTKWAPHHPGGERNIVDISGRSVLASNLSSYADCTDCRRMLVSVMP